MTSISRTHPFCAASMIIRPIRGSTGSSASFRPTSLSRWRPRRCPFSERVPAILCSGDAVAKAPSSSSNRTPSATLRSSGGSTNGKSAISPRSSAAIRKMTDARLVRRISGSVNSGRAAKSSSL